MPARDALLAVSLLLCRLELLELHGPDGQTYYVAPAHISSLREPTNADLGRYFPRNTHCVIATTNGKFLAVTEPCQTIRDRLDNWQR